MPENRRLYCSTCKSQEAHRPLNGDQEKTWVRRETGRRYVDDYWMCTAEDCRRVRSYWNYRHPLPADKKMPLFE